jgi:hypothetical protein
MINFEWVKPILEVKLIDGSLENVIKTVHWRYKGTDANEVSADVYGAQSLSDPDENDFIEFEDMTNEDVYSWLESILDVEALEENITNQIELINNPIQVIKTIE